MNVTIPEPEYLAGSIVRVKHNKLHKQSGMEGVAMPSMFNSNIELDGTIHGQWIYEVRFPKGDPKKDIHASIFAMQLELISEPVPDKNPFDNPYGIRPYAQPAASADAREGGEE